MNLNDSPIPSTPPPASALPKTLLQRIPWPLLLLIAILLALVVDRTYYLTHFGFVYTDADQTTLWYQADDISHGLIREPCFYGQSYNVPIEAWCAAPLLLLHIPPSKALPIVTVLLSLLPFITLAFLAYRRNQRWAASIILLIPLALSIEYTAVSSLPRGFINGLALATPTLACWLFFRSRRSFFLGGFFAILALTANPNSSILLLALGIYALLTHLHSLRFYLFSLLGLLAALPAPFLISYFYKLHPEANAYSPYLPFKFTWKVFNDSIFTPAHHINYNGLNLFFANLIPLSQNGSLILIILLSLITLLLLVRQFKAALATLLASTFAIFCLGIERIHMAHPEVFYDGSRMFLALPLLFALALLWFDQGLSHRLKKCRLILPITRTLLITFLLLCIPFKHFSYLNEPSPLAWPADVPPIDTVPNLQHLADALTVCCQKSNVDFVIIANGYNCYDASFPILSNHAFQTLSPNFERRTFLVTQERLQKRRNILLFDPSLATTFLARTIFTTKTLSNSPRILLIDTSPNDSNALDIAAALHITYRPHF